MIDPIALNRLHLEDALVYALNVNASTETALLRVEVDTNFHQGLSELGVEVIGEVLLDFVFFGVRSVAFDRLRDRPLEWRADEKPHDYEIATFEVKKRVFADDRYVLNLQCHLGQTCRIEFLGVTVNPAEMTPAKTHEYST